jgi:hypothetical protein
VSHSELARPRAYQATQLTYRQLYALPNVIGLFGSTGLFKNYRNPFKIPNTAETSPLKRSNPYSSLISTTSSTQVRHLQVLLNVHDRKFGRGNECESQGRMLLRLRRRQQ